MLRNAPLGAAIAACLALSAAAPATAALRPAVHSDPVPTGERARAQSAQLGAAPTPSQTLPQRWCGDELAGDDTANAYDNGPGRYHGVYFVPADRPSRLAELGSVFQRDAIAATALIERSRGRALRLDMGTRCGPEYLDITTVRLPQATPELERLARQPAGLYQAATDALAAVLPASFAGDRTIADNYIGWFDGPAPTGICGQAALVADSRRSAENMNEYGGKLALVYRQGGAFCDGDVIRHEVVHTLGAVLTGTPHVAAAGHVSDAIEDTMGAPSAPRAGHGDVYGEFFDYGGDDYWGELPWWTVDMSRFICPSADCNVVSAPRVAEPDPAAGALPEATVTAPRKAPATTKKPATQKRKPVMRRKRVCRRVRTKTGRAVKRCRIVRDRPGRPSSRR